MADVRRMWRVAMGCLRTTFSGARPYVVALMVLLMMHKCSRAVDWMCTEYSVKASFLPMFVFSQVETYYVIVFNFLFLVLACDVPLRGEHQTYVLMRSGRSLWAGGQVIYVMMLATIHTIWMVIASQIVLLGHLSFELDWGRVYYSLSQIQTPYGVSFSWKIQESFTAVQAFGLTFGLQWLCCMVLGMMILTINLASGKNVGMVLPCFFLLIFFRKVAFITGDGLMDKLSPVLVTRLKQYVVNFKPQIYYSVGYLALVVVAMIAVCLYIARHRRGGVSMNI